MTNKNAKRKRVNAVTPPLCHRNFNSPDFKEHIRQAVLGEDGCGLQGAMNAEQYNAIVECVVEIMQTSRESILGPKPVGEMVEWSDADDDGDASTAAASLNEETAPKKD